MEPALRHMKSTASVSANQRAPKTGRNGQDSRESCYENLCAAKRMDVETKAKLKGNASLEGHREPVVVRFGLTNRGITICALVVGHLGQSLHSTLEHRRVHQYSVHASPISQSVKADEMRSVDTLNTSSF